MIVQAIPDLQFPFHHVDSFDFLWAVTKKFKPDLMMNMGDEIDFHACSDYSSDPDGMSAGHELDEAIDCMHILYDMYPKMLLCTSNHTVRPLKKAFNAGIPRKLIKSYKEFLEAPDGYEWADRWVIDEIQYEHGEHVSGQTGHIKAAVQNMRSTCIGHIHSYAGINYIASHDKLIFGFNTGCLIDKDKYAFAYGKKLRQKPILGCGVIIDGIPYFIPMLLNKRGRWVKKI